MQERILDRTHFCGVGSKIEMYEFRMTILFNDDETFKGVEVNGTNWNKLFSNLNPKSTTVSTTTNNTNGTTEIKDEE